MCQVTVAQADVCNVGFPVPEGVFADGVLLGCERERESARARVCMCVCVKTLQTKPYTLQPTPYTLNPKP